MKLSKFTKFREEKFGGVLFETRSEKVFALNPTAAALVRALSAGGDLPQIVAQLQARFSAGDGAVERDAVAFIAELRQQGLVEE
jgi:hypothetical protein